MLDIENSALIDLLKTDYAPGNPGLREQLDEVAEEVERSGKPVMEIIENYGLFSRADLLQVIANSLGSYVWDPRSADVKKEVIASIDTNTARSYGVIPVALEDDTLHLAMRNPLDYQTVESLRFILGKNILPVAVDPDMFDSELERYYPEEVDSVADIIAELGPSQLLEDSTKSDEERANDAPIVKFVDVVMQQAIKDKASDIHFEPFEKEFRIRYRVDGALYEMPPPPKSLAIPVISRVKIISGLNISERRRPQDGRIQLKFQGRPVDLRVSCLPTSYGESVVLRVLDRTVVNLQLDSLGIGQDVLDKLREMIHLPNGILLVTGPTGSGKTTTLYMILQAIAERQVNVSTIEDPVERNLPRINQTQVNNIAGLTFESGLRALLRQDPDVIMVGETRDAETASISVRAAITGHMVFSTLHTNDALSSIVRLEDMGVERYMVANSVAGLVAQRLMRRVCPHCAVQMPVTDQERSYLGPDIPFVRRGKGCTQCNGTGYRGRVAIHELVIINRELREMISAGATQEQLTEAARRNQGMTSLREAALQLVRDGETTPEELLKITFYEE